MRDSRDKGVEIRDQYSQRLNLFLKSRLFSLISYTAALTQTTAGRESISSLVINSVILITFTFNKGVLLRKK